MGEEIQRNDATTIMSTLAVHSSLLARVGSDISEIKGNIQKEFHEQNGRIDSLEADREKVKGVLTTIRVQWSVLGIGGIAALFKWILMK